MAEAEAKITQRRAISKIWIVPIVALVLGAWMVVYTWQNQGPEITIRFSTADGIEAGKTKIKARSVVIGVIETVLLGEDFESVVVTARLEKSAAPLLHEDTQFWVVRARIGTGGISGLGTIVSGGYVELAPGTGNPGRRDYVGLETPPVTATGTPGLELTLRSDEAASVRTGNPILYEGFAVGRIESAEFDVELQQMRYGAFIEAPYDGLVTDTTRFWNMSGLSFSATAEGVELATGSLETLVLGGVSFGTPTGVEPGAPVDDGVVFDLYRNRKSIDERPFRYYLEYVVRFARSVRGLKEGAPVEYRGLAAGRVERIMLAELISENVARQTGGQGAPLPVLIRLEPGRMHMGDSPEGVSLLKRTIENAVPNGLRATLSTGSLITGSLYVALDYYPKEEAATLGTFAGHPTIPTIASGLEGIERQVATLLDKLNALPLGDVARSADDTLRSANQALLELEQTIADLNVLLASQEMQTLPQSVRTSLGELDRTLKRVGDLAGTLEAQPNSLIFPRRLEADPEPPAGTP